MTAFTNISNALVAVGAKPFATTMQALRDNPVAGLECDPTAPVNAAGWHPYNKVTNGDTNTGRIWSFAVDGAVAVVTTPDFVDGWDYAFLFDRINSSLANAILQINFFRETSAAYAGVTTLISANGASLVPTTGWIEFPNARLVRQSHFIWGYAISGQVADATVQSGVIDDIQTGARHATAQKILRAQFSWSTGNMTGTNAAIYMLRRRNVAA